MPGATSPDLFRRGWKAAKLECEARGHLEWANPDQGYEFKAFASAGYGLGGSAGLGAEGEFRISFQEGRFFIRAKAGVVCGLGATGSLEYAVDAALIWEFAAFTRHQLLHVGQEYQLLMEDYAYMILAAAIAWQKQKGGDLDQIVDNWRELDDWWENQPYRIDDVLGLADNLKREDDALRYAPSATLGRWLEQLRRALERTASQVKAARLQRFLAHHQYTLPAVAARNAPLGSQLLV